MPDQAFGALLFVMVLITAGVVGHGVRLFYRAKINALEAALEKVTSDRAKLLVRMAVDHADSKGKHVYELTQAALRAAFPGEGDPADTHEAGAKPKGDDEQSTRCAASFH
jgi:hypothetical protein